MTTRSSVQENLNMDVQAIHREVRQKFNAIVRRTARDLDDVFREAERETRRLQERQRAA